MLRTWKFADTKIHNVFKKSVEERRQFSDDDPVIGAFSERIASRNIFGPYRSAEYAKVAIETLKQVRVKEKPAFFEVKVNQDSVRYGCETEFCYRVEQSLKILDESFK